MATKRYISTVNEWQTLWDLGVDIFDSTMGHYPVTDASHPDYLRSNKDGNLQRWIDNRDYYIYEE